jgi:signal transduction histidine kinase
VSERNLSPTAAEGRSEARADPAAIAAPTALPVVAMLEALESWFRNPTEQRRAWLGEALAAIVRTAGARGAWLEVDAPPLPTFDLGFGTLAGRPPAERPGLERHGLRGAAPDVPIGTLWLDAPVDGPVSARALELALDAGRARASAEQSNHQLETLDEATRAIAGVLDLDRALQVIVDRVRELVRARYAALGIVGSDGSIERFITSGITHAQRVALGQPPRGHGLLGLIIREGRPLRVDDIASHPASVGFPTNHPLMTSLLGVPIGAHGRAVGNFYLTDREDGEPFSDGDQRLVERFALHAGIAIENARLHEQAAQLAVIDERDRIGRDLHDGIIQSLYAVGLSLEESLLLLSEAPIEAEERVDRAIESINLAIRDIRNFIYGLRPEALDGSNVLAGLAALAEETRIQAMVEVDASLDRDADLDIDDEAGRHLLQLAREAISNASRHGKASRVTIELRSGDHGGAVLEIADDGVGFDPSRPPGPGHHGLANMRARADAIGAALTVDSRSGAGTRIIVLLPPPGGTSRNSDETP